MQREALQRPRSISAAEDLRLAVAMRRLEDVAENLHRGALVLKGKTGWCQRDDAVDLAAGTDAGLLLDVVHQRQLGGDDAARAGSVETLSDDDDAMAWDETFHDPVDLDARRRLAARIVVVRRLADWAVDRDLRQMQFLTLGVNGGVPDDGEVRQH